MARITWDQTGERYFESGVSHGVLYPMAANGTYGAGVAWNGLIGVNNSPDGADPNELWADNIKYAVLRSAENLKLTIEAYTFPDEFYACDGMVSPSGMTGVVFGQQKRQSFGFCYRTEVGSDADNKLGYKLHLVYGCTASPSDKDYSTINDNPDAITFSWEVDTIPVDVDGMEPVAEVVIDSTKVDATKLSALEAMLYGDSGSASLPLPSAIMTMFSGT